MVFRNSMSLCSIIEKCKSKYQDVPEVVGYMEVEDYSSRAANLSWTAPYDGNSPITVYNIIYKTYRWNIELRNGYSEVEMH